VKTRKDDKSNRLRVTIYTFAERRKRAVSRNVEAPLMVIEKPRLATKCISGVKIMSSGAKSKKKDSAVSPPARGVDASGERGTLTRQDLALAIYAKVGGISRREAKRLTDIVIDEMVETLVSGETLKLHDFGSFVVREKHERSGRNPRTGAPVPIEARRVVVFKASPNMKAAVNGVAPPDRHAPSGEDEGGSGGNMPLMSASMDKA
jgi:integration host factor alpha subunit